MAWNDGPTCGGIVDRHDVESAMGRHPSTISRELKRNQRSNGYYTGSVAHGKAVARQRRERRGTQFTDDDWAVNRFTRTQVESRADCEPAGKQ